MQDKKNIFVIFSPGLGGNHVANLLATDSRYTTRATFFDYINHNKANAHIVDNNLDNLDYAQNEVGNVFCGHFGEFYWSFLNNKVSNFKNRQIILIELPTNVTSLAFERYKKYSKLNDYFFQEQRSLYSYYSINKFFDEDDLFVINSEMVFDDSVEYFVEHANKKMNFNLDYNECSKMHKIWIEKIKEYTHNAAIS